MRWNPYIDLRVEVSNAVRCKCKACDIEISRGELRVCAIPVVGKQELYHVDCGIKRAYDHAARKLKDKESDWPEAALKIAKRLVPEGTIPVRRSYQRTPLLNLSYPQTPPRTQTCPLCGEDCPGEEGALTGHAIRAFSLDGERRFHPACIRKLAPGLCRRIVLEDSERWPREVLDFWTQTIPDTIKPTRRSPWQDTGGLPTLERAPSARAACRYCSEKITKGELRLARQKVFGTRRSPVYFHVGCFARSDDYHPKILELVVLRIDPEIQREEIEAWSEVLPATPEIDDDVPPLLDCLLDLFDRVPREAETEAVPSNLTENLVEFPRGFFSSE
ncbi:MAG: hypothetical protein JKY65_16230 [Planctomycetes bacterium]|nr:hypothetical protein [Planctomycetota bacterium]